MRAAIAALIAWGIYELFADRKRWLEITLIFLYVPSLIASLLIFINKRSSIAKLTWLFVVLAIPIIGPFLYVIFAGKYKQRMPHSEYLSKYKFMNSKATENNTAETDSLNNISRYTKRPIVLGEIETSRRIMDTFILLFDDINNAKKFIHLHYYIIKRSEIWDELKNLLIIKAKQGLEIRIIVDDFGSWTLPRRDFKELRKNGIEVKLFNKVVPPFISSEDSFRTHRKYTIIDGEIGYIGGANITDEYISFATKYGAWEDVVSKVSGEAMQSINLLFIADWFFMTHEKLSQKKYNPIKENQDSGTTKMLMLEGTPEVQEPIIEDVLINLINNTKKSIQISTPYFIPSNPIFKALRYAAMKGVDITIYIPGLADKKVILFASKIFAHELMEYGIKFRESNGKFMHSKLWLFDDEVASVGTVNIDFRSLFAQLENILFFEGEKTKEIKELFDVYLKDSTKLELPARNSNTFRRIKLNFVKIIAPML